MKIQHALMSCNSNPMYVDFWPIVSMVWRKKFNIHPILLYVDNNDIELDETYGSVIKMKPIENISDTFQAQFARIWHSQFLLNDICILTDIDMIPLSVWFFKHQIKDIESSKYIITSISGNHVNVCYNIASGNTFKDYLELKPEWKDQLKIFENNIYKDNGEISWSADEIFLTEKLNNKSYIKLERDISPTRIDRSNWNYNIAQLKSGMYYDCHSLRPYNKYKKYIDELINNC